MQFFPILHIQTPNLHNINKSDSVFWNNFQIQYNHALV